MKRDASVAATRWWLRPRRLASRALLALGAALAAGGSIGVIAQFSLLEGVPAVWLALGGVALFVAAVELAALAIGGERDRRLERVLERDAELAQLSWRLDFALGVSKVGVWDVNLETDEMIWDERTRALFGAPNRNGFFNESDWIGAVHPEDRERAIEAARVAVDADGRFVQDYRVLLPDGTVRHLRDTAAVYLGEGGTRRLVGLVWDVTGDVERQAELELRRAEAEAAAVAKSRFLAMMSHEIRTPMTGVIGMLELMLTDPLSEAQRQRATVAHSSAHGLLRILNDILESSKLEAGRVERLDAPVDPRELLAEVTALMAAGAERKGLALSTDVAERVPATILTDAMRLRQILVNLLSNAAKFTEAGEVRVSMDYDAGARELAVEVADTGVGLGTADPGRLFEEFYQADSGAGARRGGTGLGLAITRQLVGLLGGRVSARSSAGGGAVFAFTIAAPAADAPFQPGAPARASSATPPQLRVLVAEDNATNQIVLRSYLARKGHAVTLVEDGVAAVRAAEAGGFDVVLMDVEMPRMDGARATRLIRELSGPAGSVPIVALTASALPGDRERYLAAGMTDFVPKPIDFALLDEALGRAASARADLLPDLGPAARAAAT
ncbi:ATP-binding protein [Amaricoccus sp.]|uniref:hybrid sensor histidine kinase/response regulator n=1 Tax=Amaricoccus sp. TaxID=1872485 RepID=UPI001B54909B|nr:ATP-binding protein [Amaricoccus sp.]MBP7242916.1 response regulator [Amaricoccus sp.]